jgi:hypothetical protein
LWEDDGRAEDGAMNTVPTHTVVGYNVNSGKKLFSDVNGASRTVQKTDTLPRAKQLYIRGDKKYRVIHVRKGSAEGFVEIAVNEEE